MASVQIRYNNDMKGKPCSVTAQIFLTRDKLVTRSVSKTFRYDESEKKGELEMVKETYVKQEEK